MNHLPSIEGWIDWLLVLFLNDETTEVEHFASGIESPLTRGSSSNEYKVIKLKKNQYVVA